MVPTKLPWMPILTMAIFVLVAPIPLVGLGDVLGTQADALEATGLAVPASAEAAAVNMSTVSMLRMGRCIMYGLSLLMGFIGCMAFALAYLMRTYVAALRRERQ